MFVCLFVCVCVCDFNCAKVTRRSNIFIWAMHQKCSWLELESATRVQILDKAVCVFFRGNIHRKVISPL